MKKIFYLLMVLALSFSFAACGGDDDDDDGDGQKWGTDINPIKGTWISESKLFKVIYTEDFKEKIYNWDSGTNDWTGDSERPYKINKESLKIERSSPPIVYYRMEGNDILYLRNDNSSTWLKYIREK